MFSRKILTILLMLMASGFCWAAGTMDSGLYTTYSIDTAKTTLSWVVCGSVGSSIGCYGAGELGPFGHLGSVIESAKVYDVREGTVTRYVYLVDQAYGSDQNGVALFVYQRVDTITGSNESTKFALAKTVTLPLSGGAQSSIFMAANKNYLVIGSSASAVPVEVNKRTLAITSLGIIGQNPNSITADNYGYITVTSANGFFVVGPDGSLQEDGGGTQFMINALLGIQP